MASSFFRSGETSDWTGPPIFAACLTVLIAGLVLGGGTQNGLLGDAILQVGSLPLVWLCVRELSRKGLGRFSTAEKVICAGLVAIPLVQLAPLPPSWWLQLPYADLRRAPFALLGQSLDYRPISMTPEATALSALSLIPSVALFVGARLLSSRRRRKLIVVVLVVALVSALLGVAQLAGGEQTPLRFYRVTNPSDAVGFFANRNHFAALLYVALLLTTPWALEGSLGFMEARRNRRLASSRLLLACASAALMFVLGVAEILTRSRAGLALTALCAIGVAAIAARDARNRWKTLGLRVFLVAIGAVVLVAAPFGFDQLMDRLALDPRGDGRLAIARNTIAAAWSYLPFGSGIGSFAKVYGQWEQPKDLIADVYVNQAHDDVLQIGLEAGLAGLALLALFWVVSIRRASALIADRGDHTRPLDIAVQRAAAMAVLCLSLHSLVDYPLRTSAGMMLFALCCAAAGKPSSSTAARIQEVVIVAPAQKRARMNMSPVETLERMLRPDVAESRLE